MTTSLTLLMNALKEQKISKYWLAYFRENFRGEINDQILESFQANSINKADIARKLDRRPEQITRWLSAPCNLEADTISDLALALGLVPKIRFEKIAEEKSNQRVHEFIAELEKTEDTESRQFLMEQSFYDSSTPSATGSSTDEPAFKSSKSSGTRVVELSPNA